MDPITMFGLVASALSVAEITTKVGMGCRHLQMEFSGALEHIDSISQQTSTIDLAIREICSIFHQRPQTFPFSFEAHLGDSISAVDTIAGQIQDHVQSIRTEADTSKSRAKLRHLRKSAQVREWGATLVVQTQALMLLLQVAQLHSNDERTTVLEKESSREVFETASSMSAKLTTSSSKFCRENEFTKFSFDSILLESKVYRRAFESSWIREVSTVLEDENESNDGGSASIMSVSSNSAIASEGDCASSFRDFDPYGPEPDNTSEPPILERADSTAFRPLPTLETSASSSYEQTGASSTANPTRSLLATTISCVDERTRFGSEDNKDNSLFQFSVVTVVVEGIGTGSTELVVREPSNHYDKSHEAILSIRDRVLLDAGVDFDSYCGVVCISAAIQTGGQLDGHRFPLTPGFLEYVVNKLRDGSYDSLSILARFASPDSSRSGPMNLTKVRLNAPYHFDFPAQATLPFTDTSAPGDRRNGGFSTVFKVALNHIHSNILGIRDDNSAGGLPTAFFAVKQLHSSSRIEFEKEAEVLKVFAKTGHPHIVRLLATYHWRGNYHLLFPWAECHLQDYWRYHPSPAEIQEPEARSDLHRKTFEQLVGISDALESIHSPSKLQGNTGTEWTESGPANKRHYRHGDLKPDNILRFSGPDNWGGVGVWRIADLGLAKTHSSSINLAGPSTRGGTVTYGAPELRHHHPGHRLSSAYDIWSFGCVLMEFACWLTGGRKELEAFKRSRYKQTRHGTFFEIKHGEIVMSPPVARQFNRLREKISVLDPPLPEALGLFLTTIKSCFEIDESKRPSAAMLVSKMRAAHAILLADHESRIRSGNNSGVEGIAGGGD